MRTLIPLMALLTMLPGCRGAASSDDVTHQGQLPSDTAAPSFDYAPGGQLPSGFVYVRDQTRFKPVRHPTLTDEEKAALAAAREHLEQRARYRPTRAWMAVARSPSGFQVNFHRVQVQDSSGLWRDVPEGFGEVFLSPEARVIAAHVGP